MQNTSTDVRRGRRHKLNWRIGQPVTVYLYQGVIRETKTTSVPFKFARSAWVVRVAGVWGAVPLARVEERFDSEAVELASILPPRGRPPTTPK